MDGKPIPNLPANKWTVVMVEGAVCRDGSPTGIGVNPNPNSDKLAIYLEGGGACFNTLTCGMNPANGASMLSGLTGRGGIFDRADAANPVKDWNFVYVPYCTGDVHAGANPSGSIPGVNGTQHFVGYTNVGLDLERIVPTFPSVTKVLLTGASAGGFGAGANYLQAARAFGSVPVYMLDDSGPFMDDPYAASCLQDTVRKLWGLDNTVLKDCGSDCPDHTRYQVDSSRHAAKAYPHVPFGLVESIDDGTITFFYGFGSNNCAGLSGLPTQLTEQQFTAGLMDLRTKTADLPNVGSFLFGGANKTQHTSIGATATLNAGTAGGLDGGAGVKLTDWIGQLVNGTVTNAGP